MQEKFNFIEVLQKNSEITQIIASNRLVIEFNSSTHIPDDHLELQYNNNTTLLLHKIRTSPRPKTYNSAAVYEIDIEYVFHLTENCDKLEEFCELLQSNSNSIQSIYPEHIGAQHSTGKFSTTHMNYNPEHWQQWYLQKTGMSDMLLDIAFDETHSYPKVAIFDTGIEVNEEGKIVHPNLVNRKNIFLKTIDKYGLEIDATRESIIDYNGHGTHICGIIGAPFQNNEGIVGLNPFSDLYIYKCSQGATEFAYLSDLIDSIYSFLLHLKPNEKAVLNVSMGFNFDKKSAPSCYSELIKYIESHDNVLLIASSGNEFSESLTFPAKSSKNYPGRNPQKGNNIIAVGATDSSNNIAPFSNFGKQLSLVAPGKSIYSTFPSLYNVRFGAPLSYSGGYAYLEGTSMSAAIVSGIASLYWGKANISAQRVAHDLCQNTVCGDIPEKSDNNYYGFGLIQGDSLIKSTPKRPVELITQRREVLTFPHTEVQYELRSLFLNLFNKNNPDFFNALSAFIQNEQALAFNTKQVEIFSILNRYGHSFDIPQAQKEAIAWGLIALFDAKYKSIWPLRSILRRFIVDLEEKDAVKEQLKNLDSGKVKLAINTTHEYDIERFQEFLHQCWNTAPDVLKEFLLIFYPDEIELFDTTFTHEMMTAFIRMSSDDNLVPITPYTLDLGKRNIKGW